jgi:hypothetical protein
LCYVSNATRLGRASIVANVIGESDTHHGVVSLARVSAYDREALNATCARFQGSLWLDVDYFYFFDTFILVGQAGDSFIDGLPELSSQPNPQRPG